MKSGLLAALALSGADAVAADPPAIPPGLAQLRQMEGCWLVETKFRQQDGSESKPFKGTYRFAWAVPDYVLQGLSAIPELEQRSAILFYLRFATSEIEMVSVGKDGRLWIMAGRDNEETRSTPDLPATGGGTMRMCFTRFAVTPKSFESRMEWSTDQGQTWTAGNHQLFVRSDTLAPCAAWE